MLEIKPGLGPLQDIIDFKHRISKTFDHGHYSESWVVLHTVKDIAYSIPEVKACRDLPLKQLNGMLKLNLCSQFDKDLSRAISEWCPFPVGR